MIERGLALGYRKSREGGAWLVRRYDSATRRHSEERLGTADDHRDADGTEVLSFSQAQRKALAQATSRAEDASGKSYTVARAVDDYLDYLRTHRKSADDAEIKLKAYVVPQLGGKRVADLRPADFDAWLAWAMKRKFTRKGKAARKADSPEQRKEDAAEQKRRRRSTVNRVITGLKACLNHAHKRRKVADASPWATLGKFRNVDAARVRWLTLAETKRLLNACRPDLRVLVQAGLLTGCREGELLAVHPHDFDSVSGTLLIPDSKSGKPRRVPLSSEGIALMESATAGLDPDAIVFKRKDGSPWHRVAIIRAMQEASEAAKLSPPATFYTLRHTYASHLVQQGTPLLFVAAALGHRDTRMVEKHYGHFGESHVAAQVRANLPDFGIIVDPKVRSIGSSKKPPRNRGAGS